MMEATGAALILLAATGIALLLVQPPLPLAAAERLFAATAFRLLAPLRPPDQRVVLIGITEKTLAAFPYRSPVDRGFLTGLLDSLGAAGVTAIGLDILLDRPTEPAKDTALRAAIRREDVPVVVISLAPETPLPPEQSKVLAGFLDGVRTGTANLARDRFDGQVRVHVPRHPATGAPSFASALVAAVGGTPPQEEFPIRWRRTATGPVAPSYPAEAVSLLPQEWLRGRIALVGALLPGSDEHRSLPTTFGRPSFGLEIHAQILAQMLDSRTIATGSGWMSILPVVFFAALGLAAGARLTGRVLILTLGGVVLAWLAAVMVAQALDAAPLATVAPVLACLLAGGVTRAWRGRGERRDRAALHGMFARFLSPQVAEALLRDRALYFSGGRPKPQELTATVLFSDIAGFTTICETMPAEPLIAWLDRYIEVMVRIVVAHEGVVLRFIGDGMLVVFGAPIARRDDAGIAADARAAARCAQAMEVAMTELNAEWCAAGMPEGGLRIGIHTGPMVAGSLGQGERMEYCLLGDNANVGARLEQLGKQHGGEGPRSCTIMISDVTWALLGGAFSGRRVGELVLRNRRSPMGAWRIDAAALHTESTVNNSQVA
jgi:adenylate cyclase